MRIQAIQNPQTQNRPSFSALGVSRTPIPHGASKFKGKETELGQQACDELLRELLALAEKITRIPLRRLKRFNTEAYTYDRFRLGDDHIILVKDKVCPGIIPQIWWQRRNEGVEKVIRRNYHFGNVTTADPEFDRVQQMLELKAVSRRERQISRLG